MYFILAGAAVGLLSIAFPHVDQVFQHPYIQPIATKRGTTAFYCVVAAFLLIKRLNRILNAFALSNWSLTARGTWDWPTEIAVVTGGCGGIGKELVSGLRKKAVKVAVLDLLPPPSEFEEDDSILYVKTDLTSPAAIDEAARKIRATFGHPSIVINNAGIASPHSILDTPPGFLPKIFGVNAVALWLTTQAFLPDMIEKNKGHILNTGSITAYMALPSMVDYCASKAAALTFHQGLNCELKTKYGANGIITTVVQPTWVRTGMSPSNADEIEQKQGKMLRPEEVAEASLGYIWSCKGGQVVLPERMSFFSGLQGWPNWGQELLRDAMGRASLI